MPGVLPLQQICTRTPRCVKCAGNHLAKECEKPFGDTPKCCLCGGEHPANFLGCPKNPKPEWMQKKKGRGCKELHVPIRSHPKRTFGSSEVKLPHRAQLPNPALPPHLIIPILSIVNFSLGLNPVTLLFNANIDA
ncbi:hypothetical protein TNCT_455841 [Trichonephila clavata]|uniref:Nucleic-acid-binding protein from transposon X-element n=1 Tax=Trichonephila clavata TaxID=2740835 RepID=A0A8X6KWZ2_TRICU|nr:hypothetical protein TNCT_455841 [Trichonephila clavata]